MLQTHRVATVGRMADGMVHEINNLLTVVAGHGQCLLDEPRLGPGGHGLVREVLKAGDRAATIIRRLWITGDRRSRRPAVIDLNRLVADLERPIQHLAGNDIGLNTVLSPAPSLVRADAWQLEQAMLGLVIRACSAMPDGGQLVVETTNLELTEDQLGDQAELQPGPHALLAIRDTGNGNEVDAPEYLLVPSLEVDEELTDLDLVRNMVRREGGEFLADSEPGQGTTYLICLPRVGGPALSPARPAAILPHGTETVLVAEDDATVREVMRRVLEAAGYRVLEAATGAEALALAGRHLGPIDLLVTDVVMPGMGGGELADCLTVLRPGMPVLYVSGHSADVTHGYAVPGSDGSFLPKPFTPLALAECVRALLDTARRSNL